MIKQTRQRSRSGVILREFKV